MTGSKKLATWFLITAGVIAIPACGADGNATGESVSALSNGSDDDQDGVVDEADEAGDDTVADAGADSDEDTDEAAEEEAAGYPHGLREGDNPHQGGDCARAAEDDDSAGEDGEATDIEAELE